MEENRKETVENESGINFDDQPLSPVLGTSHVSRKYVPSRKKSRKTRINLMDRFPAELQNVENKVDEKQPDLFVDKAFTPSEEQNILESIEIFRKMDEKQTTNQELQPQDEICDDIVFRKPLLPSPFSKQMKTFRTFQTAAGKVIQPSSEMIEKSKGLFYDILNPNTLNSSRSKKYSFLSKSETNNYVEFIDNKNEIIDHCVPPATGFTKASGQKITISESALMAAKHLFNEDFNSLKAQYCSNTEVIIDNSNKNHVSEQIINCVPHATGFTKASGQKIAISESALKTAKKFFNEDFDSLKPFSTIDGDVNSANNDTNVLCSQETDTWFANFTTIEDKICNMDEHDANDEFKGLMDNSQTKAQEFIIEYKNSINKLEHHKKRPLQDFSSLPAQKKFKSDEGFISGLENTKIILKASLKSQKIVEKVEINADFPKNNIEQMYDSTVSKTNLNFELAAEHALIPSEDVQHNPDQISGNLFDNNCSNDERHDSDLNSSGNSLTNTARPGFHTASRDVLKLSEDAMKLRFQDDFSTQKNCYSTSNKENNITTLNMKNRISMCGNSTGKGDNVSGGFKTASGNSLKLSEEALERAKKIFQDDFPLDMVSCNNLVKENEINNSRGKSGCSKNTLHTNLKDSVSKDNNLNGGFQTASGTSLRLSANALERAKALFQDDFPSEIISCNNIVKENLINTPREEHVYRESTLHRSKKASESNHSSGGFQTASGASLKLSEGARHMIFKDDFHSKASVDQENTSLDSLNSSKESSPFALKSSDRPRKKRRLGMSSSHKPITVSNDKLEKAKLLFAGEKLHGISPIRIDNQASVYNSTPLKNDLAGIHVGPDITPIKNEAQVVKMCVKECLGDGRILVRECTKGDINLWINDLEMERRRLENHLKVLIERQENLKVQKCLLEINSRDRDRNRRRPGVLFNKKHGSDRVALQDVLDPKTINKSSNITPKNAEFVHFNCTEQYLSSVKTLDGASVIPNVRNFIGFREIESAFKVMPGVESHLIPKGWIRNHFKWIVWKLASYEKFSTNLKDCLTVENVIQQLKYRYDREIDRAERPALRKILEKDDVPQKRMVLCVSDIFKLDDNKFELELTDGWYSIRTVIDEPLCSQVFNEKIVVGTKLITCGAELLNCDGCHPLEATDLIRLRISCNSTRRAVWYAKLGYQRSLEPFPLKLRTLYPAGGLVGCIKIYITRVYPVKYLEKKNKLTIWRNKKAEELQAQNWENERLKRVEEMREVARKDYEKSIKNQKQNVRVSLNSDDIKNIKCPETLYNLYQSSKDPDSLEEMLSQTQKNSVMEYQQRLSFQQQQELNKKIQDGVDKLQFSKRDVTPVQQLLVIDVLDVDERAWVFQIWKPTEMHLQLLKESSAFYVFNVMSKKNVISSTNRTKFQADVNVPVKHKYKRILVPIPVICDLATKPLFNEFDTVGIIVQIVINSFNQFLWLADPSGRLLFVNIFEGPKSCLLLDNLKSGQVVSASNLIFCKSMFGFGEAIANHLTVISCYPQQKHLQEGIESVNEQFPKDLGIFLEDCIQKVTHYTDRINITDTRKNSSSKSLVKSNSLSSNDVFDDSCEESTLIYSRITSTDVALSLIDIDKLA